MSNLFKSKKETTQKTEIDPRVYNEVLQNLQLARQISQIPFEPYRGMMVAPFTQDYMMGEQMTRDIARQGGFVPEIEGAARQAGRLMDFTPERVAAERVGTQFTPERVAAQQLATQFGSRDIGQSLAGGPERVTAGQIGTQFTAPTVGAERVGTTFGARDVTAPGAAPMMQAASVLGPQGGQSIADYMNPYQQGVIDVGLSDIDRAGEQARMQRAQRATAARAFGGSRAAVEEGIAAGEAARERNRFIAEQRAQGFREAAQMREADVGRQQQAGLANQQAAMQVMQLAQAGQISNQERDLRLGQLGLTAEQANQAAQMQANLANQQAMQEAQRMGMTAEQFNAQQGMQAQLANQQAVQQYMQMGLSAEEANQRANLDAQRLGLTAGQANQDAALRAALANQQMGMQGQQLRLQAQGMNQDAAMRAALANQQAGLTGAQFQLGAGRQFADLGQQALQNRYGAAAAMTGLGSAQQQLMQQYLNAQREEFMRRVNFPMQQLAIAQGAVSASPYNVTQYGKTVGTPSPMQMIGQAASTAMGLGWGGIGGGGGGASFGSDENMKRNIKLIKNPLDKVNRLRGIEFEWEDGYGSDEYMDEGGKRDMSVSAQDVIDVMPEAVSERDSDGMMEVGTPQMIGLLTGAVQELDKKIEGKKRRRKSA